MESDDPLLELVVDAVEVDRQRIAAALRGVVAIDKSGAVIPAQGYQALNSQQKILAYLLGRKVAVLLELAEKEAIGPKDIAASTGLAEGTVYPTVRKLHGERLASQDVDSRYYLSPHQVGTAIDALTSPVVEAGDGPDADDLGNGPNPPAAPPNRRRSTTRRPQKSTAKPRSNGKKDQGEESGGSARKRSTASGFSPTSAIRDLITSGFFKEPKGLADVQQRLKDKQGRDVPVTTLSPVFTRMLREGALDRTRNSEGVYEYVSTQAA